MKRVLFLLLILLHMAAASGRAAASSGKVVVAYVTSWTQTIPDPAVATHLNYAFGHVNDTFDGVRIDNPGRLLQIVELKRQNPGLKVLLSIGGWGSGRFSEMASSDTRRQAFARDALRVTTEYGLDGIDIDWEYPTQSSAGISSSPDDTRNFTLLMRDLRQQLGNECLLTIASVASGEYIDFRSCIAYLDMVNVMAYDMASAPRHHSALYPSDISGWMTTSQAVDAHLRAGVPREKLVMGMPLYGRGLKGYDADPKASAATTEHWHELAMVPYLTDSQGQMVMGYENERSLGIKCQYILDHGLRGGMYWEYGDDRQASLRQTICNILMKGEAGPYPADYAGSRVRFRALLLWEPHAETAHVEFDRQALQFFHKLSYGEGFTYDVRTSCPDQLDTLRQYDVVVMLNTLPASPAQRRAFEQYMEQGGGWMGFHATGYNDRNTHWPWLNKFLGCGPFLCNNWPPQSALVEVEGDDWHPVTRSLPRQFVVPASEFYQFSPSPRANADVEVLLSISPKNYPLGIKDIVTHGDFPIVWTNKRYRMVYLNMGHGDETFSDATQNLLITNAFRWVANNPSFGGSGGWKAVLPSSGGVGGGSPRVLVLAEPGGQHEAFTQAGLRWLHRQAEKMDFSITKMENASLLKAGDVSSYDMVIQLNYPPYEWSEVSMKEFEQAIDQGKIAWIGFHHASLLGEFDGFPLWRWFSDFLGGIRFQNYIAEKADGEVIVEQPAHPVMTGVSPHFVIPDDEWYTYDHSPRPNVQVLASVDEQSYRPASEVKMGDHPVIWTNPAKPARNVYFQIGHSASLFENSDFVRMFDNALRWGLNHPVE